MQRREQKVVKKIKTAVIGIGHQGRWHADKFAALSQSDLVAVVDPDSERCQAIAAELRTTAVDDYHDLIGRVDAVSIASPTSTHFKIASTLLENKIHVLLEKPITNTLEEAASLVELAESNEVVLQVGHLERFNPAIIAIGQLLDQPLFIESTRIAPFSQRSVDVSVVLDLMIHDIDLIHALVGSAVKSIDASGVPVISNDIDIANARITFDNGCVANVTASRASFKTERKLRVFQHNTYASLDLHQKKSLIYRKTGKNPTFSQDDISIEEKTFDASDALMTQSEAFLNSISGGPPPLVSGRVGMQALETALSISDLLSRS